MSKSLAYATSVAVASIASAVASTTLILTITGVDDPPNSINISNSAESIFTTDINASAISNKLAGQTFGGSELLIDGVATTFTVVQTVGFNGTVNTDATVATALRTDGNGLAINSAGTQGADQNFNLDGQEAFTLRADQALFFEGLALRGFSAQNSLERQLTITSSAWIGLTGVTPGSGVAYNSLTGSFVLSNSVLGGVNFGTVTLETLVGVGGPQLEIGANTDFTFANTATGGAGYGFTSFTFSAIPEPTALGLALLGALPLVRRRR